MQLYRSQDWDKEEIVSGYNPTLFITFSRPFNHIRTIVFQYHADKATCIIHTISRLGSMILTSEHTIKDDESSKGDKLTRNAPKIVVETGY